MSNLPPPSPCLQIPSRSDYAEMIESHPGTKFVTLTTNATNPNSPASRWTLSDQPAIRKIMRTYLRRWDALMNGYLLGDNWRTSASRLQAIGVIEKPGSNPHWHLKVTPPPPPIPMLFGAAARKAWGQIILAGTAHVQPIRRQGVISSYMAKELSPKNFNDRIIFVPFDVK